MSSDQTPEQAHFNELLVKLEHDLGTRDTCILFLTCMRRSVQLTKFKNKEALKRQMMEFYELFVHLKPRMAIIQNYLDHIVDVLAEEPDAPIEKLFADIDHRLEDAEKDNDRRNEGLMTNGMTLIKNGQTILIHSNSHSVLDVLVHAKKSGKAFKVIVAEQETNLTLEMVKTLRENEIPFTVVPGYMLAYVAEDISFMLIGALTFKHDMQFVVYTGTSAVVAEMKEAKVPVHLLMTTNKFSYWKTRDTAQTVKTVKSEYHKSGDFHYESIAFSHGRLPIDQVTSVVTEEGIFTPKELTEAYAKKLAEYKKQAREIAGIEAA